MAWRSCFIITTRSSPQLWSGRSTTARSVMTSNGPLCWNKVVLFQFYLICGIALPKYGNQLRLEMFAAYAFFRKFSLRFSMNGIVKIGLEMTKLLGILEKFCSTVYMGHRVKQEGPPTSWWGSAKRDVTLPTATVVYNACYHLLRKRSCTTLYRLTATTIRHQPSRWDLSITTATKNNRSSENYVPRSEWGQPFA